MAYKICKEMQAAPGSGKPSQHNVVFRDAEGGYSTVEASRYPGYDTPELEPVNVEDVDLVSAMANPDPPTEGVYESNT